MDIIFEVGLDILSFIADIYYNIFKDDKLKISFKRRKVLRFLSKNWNEAFTAEEIENRVLRKTDIEVVHSILDYIRTKDKVVILNGDKEINKENILWKYKDSGFWA